MGIRVDVLPLDVNTPGHGLLRITGWDGDSQGLQCSLQSSQTLEFLHEGKQWGNVAHWFALGELATAEDGQALQTRVGPELIDPLLEASGTANFRIEVSHPQHGVSELGMVRINAAVLGSASGSPVLEKTLAPAPAVVAPAPAPVVEPTPAPAPAPVDPEPVVAAPEPVIEPPQPITPPEPPATPRPAAPAPKSGNRWLLPLILLLVLAAAAAGAWWWFTQRQQPAPAVEKPSVEQPAAPAAEPAAAVPCTLESMQGQSELAFVQACIQQAPNSAALLEVINTAKANNHCGVAQRLYANRAQGGDVQIATAYAREYDPKYHQPSECFKAPDNATAAYWYETILGFDEQNSEARARFEELKP